MSNEKKSGMYGDLPKIQVRKWTIAEMSEDENCATVWIENTETGEGGQFDKGMLAVYISLFFERHF